MSDLRNNNFDLIRLIAALQVVILHTKEHLKIENEILDLISKNFLRFIPGVPIFFVISGFLIYSSYERNNKNITQYIVNRSLRIFPALWICFLLTLLLLFIDFDGNIFIESPKDILLWSIGQLTFFQFYTPDILRFWGVGTPNGSLWTITVEIQFYILIPLIYSIFSKFKQIWKPFIIIFLISICANVLIISYKSQGESIIEKLGNVFVLPYLYYFLIGILFKKYWNLISGLFKNKFWIWSTLYLIYILIFHYFLNCDVTSYWIYSPLNLFADILLAGCTLSLSFSFIGLGQKILKGNDISYGLYIYHMLIVNFMVQRNLISEEYFLFVVIIVSIILASISWLLVEKKALESKNAITKAIIFMLPKRQHGA